METLHNVSLSVDNLSDWTPSPIVLTEGILLYVVSGEAKLEVNFESWRLCRDGVIVLFPGDVVQAEPAEGFAARLLCYDTALLREASLQMELTVYSLLRADRCRGDRPVVSAIVSHMMDLLQVFFEQPDCRCLDQLVLLQLKAFFLGFSDFLRRNPRRRPHEAGSDRVNGLFSDFMHLVADTYMSQRKVAYYASELSVSSKYLGQIVVQKTGLTPKTIIDHYVVLQLEFLLRTSSMTVKEIAWNYHFADVSFFCRYFKSHTGLTPQDYRRKVLAGEVSRRGNGQTEKIEKNTTLLLLS